MADGINLAFKGLYAKFILGKNSRQQDWHALEHRRNFCYDGQEGGVIGRSEGNYRNTRENW